MRIMNGTKGILGGLLFAALLLACSGTTYVQAVDAVEGGTGDSGAGYTLDNVCASLPEKVCASRKSCCTQTAGYDEAACITRERENCLKDVAEVRAGTMRFDGTLIDGCVAKITPHLDKCFLAFDDFEKVGSDLYACHVFAGSLETGASCERDSQCRPPSDASSFGGCSKTTKKCATNRILSEGDLCRIGDDMREFCKAGLYCNVNVTLTGKCEKATPLGAACKPGVVPGLPSLECGLGYYCNRATSGCTVALDGGSACTEDIQCKSVRCREKKCQPVEPLVNAKECGLATDGGT